MEFYIDLKKLEFVLAVARDLNVGKAAARLKFSQSYVSRGIKEFEEQQRVTFFERNGRRIVSVTSEGRAYIESIESAFHVFQAQSMRASESAKMTTRKNAGAFLLGYSPLAPAAISNEIRSIRNARFQALRLQIRQLTPSEMFDSIASGLFQAGVTYAFPGWRDLDQIPIGSEPLYAVYVRRPGAGADATVELENLQSRSLLVLSSDRERPEIRGWLQAQCAAAGFVPKIAEEPATAREAFDLVQDGVGIAVMPGAMCVGMPPSLQCSPIVGIQELQLVLAYRHSSTARTQRIIMEIANSLRRASAHKAS